MAAYSSRRVSLDVQYCTVAGGGEGLAWTVVGGCDCDSKSLRGCTCRGVESARVGNWKNWYWDTGVVV
jgi:hypothetical protein